MKIAKWTGIVLLLLTSCHSGSKDKDDGLRIAVDTADIHRIDSANAEQRRSDSVLENRAGLSPGINAGAGTFDIHTPSGWRRTDSLLGRIRAVVLDTASASIRFRTNISIVTDSLRGLTIDEYVRGAITSLAQYEPQFYLFGKGNRPVGAYTASWIHYSQDRGGTAIENICYMIPDRKIVYIITCSALKGRLKDNYRKFEGALRSFMIR